MPLHCPYPSSWVHWTIYVTYVTRSSSPWSFSLEGKDVQHVVLLWEHGKQILREPPVSPSLISGCCRNLLYIMLLWAEQAPVKLQTSLCCYWRAVMLLSHKDWKSFILSCRFSALFFCLFHLVSLLFLILISFFPSRLSVTLTEFIDTNLSLSICFGRLLYC